ncbi:MAG: SDR family oxidoreductase [Alphaproteobacteria bacterium]
MGRPGTSEEVGHVAVFLASGEAVYVTGQLITVDGGNRRRCRSSKFCATATTRPRGYGVYKIAWLRIGFADTRH